MNSETHRYLTASEYFRMSIVDRYPGRELYLCLALEKLPARDLPILRQAFWPVSCIHPGHLLVPGQAQAATIAPYHVIPFRAHDGLPINCNPQNGELWVTEALYRVIISYDQYNTACVTSAQADWRRLWTTVNRSRPILAKYPILWTPSVAAASAQPGAIVELIHFGMDYRFYAVITDLIAMDGHHVLFYARMLGTLNYSTQAFYA